MNIHSTAPSVEQTDAHMMDVADKVADVMISHNFDHGIASMKLTPGGIEISTEYDHGDVRAALIDAGATYENDVLALDDCKLFLTAPGAGKK